MHTYIRTYIHTYMEYVCVCDSINAYTKTNFDAGITKVRHRTNMDQQYDQYDLIVRLMVGDSLSKMTVALKNENDRDYQSRISYEVNPNMECFRLSY